MKKKLIIFDLDGVLIDSLNNMKIALKNTEKKMAIKLNFSKYKKFIGLPFEMIMKNMGIKNNINLIKKNYIYFSDKELSSISIKKNELKKLQKLKKKYNLAVYTSKDRYRTKKILNKYNLFKCIVTSDDVLKGKPNPEGLVKILKKTSTKKQDCAYIGDTLFDYKTAKNAKIKYIHASWGYNKKINKVRSIIKIKNFLNISDYLEGKKL